MATDDDEAAPRATIKSAQDFVGGLALIALSVLAYWQGFGLQAGTLGGMGPGMLPKALAVGLGLLGLVLVASSLMYPGEGLNRWPLRALIFVIAAIAAFGFTIRPLGLAVAGPLTILISGLATSDTRWLETMIFGLVMTAGCLALFRFALSLPIPVAPWLIGY